MSWFSNLFSKKPELELVEGGGAIALEARADNNVVLYRGEAAEARLIALEEAARLVESWLILDDSLKASMAAQIRELGKPRE